MSPKQCIYSYTRRDDEQDMFQNEKTTFELEVLTGQRFGRLTVVSYFGRRKKNTYWTCLCDCDTSLVVGASNLKREFTTSCGCLRREKLSARSVHGMKATPEYSAWCRMIQRCHNPNHKDFAKFGGQGITVCQEWRRQFVSFLNDVGSRPSKQHRLVLLPTARTFSKETCGWRVTC
jgi:hypothetical protein